jgi:hypothetical protein
MDSHYRYYRVIILGFVSQVTQSINKLKKHALLYR